MSQSMNPKQQVIRLLGVIPGADDATGMWFSRRQMATIGAGGIISKSFFLRSRTSPRMILREVRRLREEIREFAPDVVHAHFGTMTAAITVLVSDVPVVITFHGSDLNPAPGNWWLRSKLGQVLSHFAVRRASQVICVSSQLKDRIRYLTKKVHVIPCGVNLNRFSPLPQRECRAKLGWRDSEKVVLFNARTDPVGKRLDLAEAAAAHARREIPNLRLHVFRGATHPDEMPLYYSAADALLMASDYEGSPMVVKEAMACNLPVVSVDVGDVLERLAGVDPSAIVARDPAIIGDALARILNMQRRSNGREIVAELSEQAITARLAVVYRLAVGIDETVHTTAARPAA